MGIGAACVTAHYHRPEVSGEPTSRSSEDACACSGRDAPSHERDRLDGWRDRPCPERTRRHSDQHCTRRFTLWHVARPQEQAEASVSVLPVRIDGAEGVAFEDSFQQGVKRESLRSLCRVVNATKLPLEVALTKLEPTAQETGTLIARRAEQQVRPCFKDTGQP